MPDLSITFTGIKFENPFLLSSAPPTESESNILRAFEAGWAGVVTKTIGVHPVVNVKGPKTNFLRTDPAPRSTPPGIGSSSPTSRSTGGSAASRGSRRRTPERS